MQFPVSGVPAASTLRPVLACSQVGVPGLVTADPQMDGMGFLPHGALNLAEETDEQTHSYAPTGEGPGQKHGGRQGEGATGSFTLAWSQIGTRGNDICWVKKRAGERHSRHRQHPEQRLRGGAEQGLCTIKEERKVTAARSQRALNIRGLQLQRECRLTRQSAFELVFSILKLGGSTSNSSFLVFLEKKSEDLVG